MNGSFGWLWQVHFVRADAPDGAPKLIRERTYGVRYDVDSHAPSRSLLLTSNAVTPAGMERRPLALACSL